MKPISKRKAAADAAALKQAAHSVWGAHGGRRRPASKKALEREKRSLQERAPYRNF